MKLKDNNQYYLLNDDCVMTLKVVDKCKEVASYKCKDSNFSVKKDKKNRHCCCESEKAIFTYQNL